MILELPFYEVLFLSPFQLTNFSMLLFLFVDFVTSGIYRVVLTRKVIVDFVLANFGFYRLDLTRKIILDFVLASFGFYRFDLTRK